MMLHIFLLIIKNFNWCNIQNLSIDNVYYCDHPRESLFRFASDIIIAPITSGAIITNFALGLPTLPIYSEQLAYKLPKITNRYDAYPSDFCQSFSTFIINNQNAQPIEYYNLVPPISLEDSDAILEIIFNKTYWNNFSKKVEIAKEKYFGNVILEDSVTRTVNYVLDILMRD